LLEFFTKNDIYLLKVSDCNVEGKKLPPARESNQAKNTLLAGPHCRRARIYEQDTDKIKHMQ
jgi:hypothetical protein